MPERPLPDVTDVLPHRGRFLLLTRLLRLDADGVEAEGHFSVDDCQGHFPDQPVVPGVLLLEGLAQTMACAHLSRPQDAGGRPYLAGFEKVRFRAPVLPPATVVYSVRFTEERFGLVTASGTARVDGKRVCTARLTGAVLPADAGPPPGADGS